MSAAKILNFPDDLSGTSRRSFLKGAAGTAAAAMAWPLGRGLEQSTRHDEFKSAAARLASNDAGDEKFWGLVKAQFPVRAGLIMLNAANLCPSPLSVQKRVFELTRAVDADPSFQNRAGFTEMKESVRTGLARYLRAHPDEIALVRNTSEGNNIVINGLTLGKGDEVLIWDQNHPTANVAWDVRAERHGFSVKRVFTPENPSSPEQLVRAFTRAFTPRTRVLAFSHVSNVSGVRIMAGELCRIARENGILTLVDGAQTFGTYQVFLHEMGCDFFTGSAHKWFCGPKEVGILYVRRDRTRELWPSIVGVGWETAVAGGARKFETLGQQDDSRISAMREAVEFHDTLGLLRVISRARILADAVKHGLRKKLPGVRFVTPMEHPMSWGVVVFNAPGIDPKSALDRLYLRHNVGCAVMGANIRYSPHFYNTLDDIARAVDAIAKLSKG